MIPYMILFVNRITAFFMLFSEKMLVNFLLMGYIYNAMPWD